MRRTYRSGKDEGGLERIDLISAIDAKSSLFDAFYIQNIKNTKRELSRVERKSRVVYSKVRKRKYVKRMVKKASAPDEETTGCDQSSSANLTPDKSIHVKRELDPFDLLLMSSPAIKNNPASPQRVSEKKYGQMKTKKKTEFNYCYNETTDKNEFDLSSDDTKGNMTSFNTHELIIEPENNCVPDKHEDSMTTLLKNISFLRNSERSPSKCTDNIYRFTLNTNQKSASSEKSPQCSTPFTEKYRGKSIYNISPIKMSFSDLSEVFENNLCVQDNCEISNNDKDQTKNTKDDSVECMQLLLTSNPFNKTCKNNVNKCLRDNQNNQPIDSNFSSPIQNTPIPVESSFISKEMTPLFGFSNSLGTTINNIHQESIQSPFTSATLIRGSLQKHENTCNYSQCSTDGYITVSTSDNEEESYSNGLRSENEITELLYDTCSNNESIAGVSAFPSLCPVVVLKRLNDSLVYKYYNKKANAEVSYLDSTNESSINYDIVNSSCCQEIANLTDIQNESCNITVGEDFVNEDKSIIDSLRDYESFSFVTIRRGNADTKKSVIYISDDSDACISESETDKIVSNNTDDSSRTRKRCIKTKEEYKEEEIKTTCEHHYLENDTVKNFNESGNEIYFKLDTTVVAKNLSNVVAQENIEGEIDDNKEFVKNSEVKPPVVLKPGKKWERSLSIYKRMTVAENSENSLLDNENTEYKGRKYRQSIIAMMEMQNFRGTLYNESFKGRRSTSVCKPSRSTIKIVKENNHTRPSICSLTTYEELRGLVPDDCDDTIADFSKLSLEESVREVTVLENLQESGRDSGARDFVLRRCGQTDALLFDECYPDSELKNCHKIGEGVYGEVFLWRARDGRARVLKIIPIAGDIRVNGEPQKGYNEIIAEIVIAMELSALRAPITEIDQRLDAGEDIDASLLHSIQNATDVFNEVLAARCVRGRYPARLLELWELYDECRGSENDCPASLPVRQHYIVLELRNAGQDLESYTFNSAEQAHALFLQLALGLAVAEEALQFEHRDLHWGNVLVSPTEQKFATFVLRGRLVRVPRRGVACTVIDYSLSRLTLGDAALYADLAADDTLFEAVGDHQFTVYRLMRDRLGNEWKNFEPFTNVLWLNYVADKMITSLRYKRTNTKTHKHYIAKLEEIKDRLLDYGSATQFVLTDNEF